MPPISKDAGGNSFPGPVEGLFSALEAKYYTEISNLACGARVRWTETLLNMKQKV